MSRKTVTVRLTPEEADLVYRNADGWRDAGSCKGGLEEDEAAALDTLIEQISRQIHPEAWKKVGRAAKDR